jgi:hypothetical protein
MPSVLCCVCSCHTDRSGFSGPWTRAPTTFSNLYFKELLENKWTEKKWNGPRQFTDPTGTPRAARCPHLLLALLSPSLFALALASGTHDRMNGVCR